MTASQFRENIRWHFAATILYIGSLIAKEEEIQKEKAAAAGITGVTLRNGLRALMEKTPLVL